MEEAKRDAPLLKIEWQPFNAGQELFIRTVVMPEIEFVLSKYAHDLCLLRESEEN